MHERKRMRDFIEYTHLLADVCFEITISRTISKLMTFCSHK